MSKIHLHSRATKEQNKEALKRAMWKSPEEMELRESIKADLGIDIAQRRTCAIDPPGLDAKGCQVGLHPVV